MAGVHGLDALESLCCRREVEPDLEVGPPLDCGGLAPRTAQQLQGVPGEAAHGGLVAVNLQELGYDDMRDSTIDYDDDSCYVNGLWSMVEMATSPVMGTCPGAPPGLLVSPGSSRWFCWLGRHRLRSVETASA